MPRKRSNRIVPAVMTAAICCILLIASAFGAFAGGGSTVIPPAGVSARDRADDAGGMVELAWEPSPSGDILYYRVYRCENAAGPFSFVGEHCTESFVDYLSWVDTGLTDGTTYYYRVTAVDSRGEESPPSAAVQATPSAQLFQAAFKTSKSITISIAEQRLYYRVENGRVAKVFQCSTGRAGDATPPGTYKVLYHTYEMPIAKYPGTVCYYWLGFAPDYGIHGWPTYNGVTSDTSAIGQPASHGCVRLLPDEAPIVYNWAPDGIPVNIISEAFAWPPAPIAGGSDALGVTEPSTSWYFAEGYTADSFDEYILIMNPAETAADVDIDYMLPDGSVVKRSYTVNPISRYTVHVDEEPGLGATDVSAHVTSDVGVIAERAMYFDYKEKQGGHVTSGATEPSTNWYFAEGYTGGNFDEYLCLQNPGDVDTVVTLSFLLDDGTTSNILRELPAHSRQTVLVNEVSGLDDCNNSVRLTAPQGFIAERAMYFEREGAVGGHCTVGSTGLATRWELAEGYTGGGFDEYVLIENPGGTPATAAVSFFKDNGEVIVESCDILAHSRYTIAVDEVPGCESTSVSVQVDGGGTPLMVERAMYFNQDGRDGGHCSIGAREASTNWYFAEGYTADSFDSFILLENPDPVLVAHVDLYLIKPGGGPVKFSYTVSPSSRVTVHVDELDAFGSAEFSALVSSDTPVISERAIYFCILR